MQKQNAAMWKSMDYLAQKMKISCSRLAKNGGLDATTFNKSKRKSKYGQLRWLSMVQDIKNIAHQCAGIRNNSADIDG